jgi:hypothetical protein
MYLPTTKRTNKDGFTVTYYQLAHNERAPVSRKPVAKIIHNCGRADELDRVVLEWLAAMCCHVPNKGEQMVRDVGFYSNVSRGKRKMQDQDGVIPSILNPDGSSREYRKNWAHLNQCPYRLFPPGRRSLWAGGRFPGPPCENDLYYDLNYPIEAYDQR